MGRRAGQEILLLRAVYSVAAYCPLRAAHCLLPTAYCPPPTADCPPPTAYREFVFTHRPQPDTINSRNQPDAALSQLIPQPAPWCIYLLASWLTALRINLI